MHKLLFIIQPPPPPSLKKKKSSSLFRQLTQAEQTMSIGLPENIERSQEKENETQVTLGEAVKERSSDSVTCQLLYT